jgi:hypothetical protein
MIQMSSSHTSNPAIARDGSHSHRQAWNAIIFFTLLIILLVMGRSAPLLRPLLPILSFLVGLFLFKKHPAHYLGFAWSLWLFTPFLARIADFQSAWDSQRVMLITPFLVSAISSVTFFKNFGRLVKQGETPFVLVTIGLGYGILVGLSLTAPMNVIRALLDWMVPVFFGFHLFWNWKAYPIYADALRKTFTAGVLVTGIYGIFQYMTAPEWDCQWLIDSGMNTSLGNPEPFQLRVWSTMHSAGPFASFLMAGLLLLLSDRSALKLPATIVGYLSFLLSLVRSSWGGWLIGFFSLVSSVNSKIQIRLIVFALIASICVVPLSQMEPFSETISGRVSSISNLEDDTSFNVRSENFGEFLLSAVSNPLGQGLGNVWRVNSEGNLVQLVTDSGIADILFTLGILGGIPYVAGTFLLMTQAMRSPYAAQDTFINASRSISLSLLLQIIFANAFLGVGGMLIWTFLGISLAGDRYYKYQSHLAYEYEFQLERENTGEFDE